MSKELQEWNPPRAPITKKVGDRIVITTDDIREVEEQLQHLLKVNHDALVWFYQFWEPAGFNYQKMIKASFDGLGLSESTKISYAFTVGRFYREYLLRVHSPYSPDKIRVADVKIWHEMVLRESSKHPKKNAVQHTYAINSHLEGVQLHTRIILNPLAQLEKRDKATYNFLFHYKKRLRKDVVPERKELEGVLKYIQEKYRPYLSAGEATHGATHEGNTEEMKNLLYCLLHLQAMSGARVGELLGAVPGKGIQQPLYWENVSLEKDRNGDDLYILMLNRKGMNPGERKRQPVADPKAVENLYAHFLSRWGRDPLPEDPVFFSPANNKNGGKMTVAPRGTLYEHLFRIGLACKEKRIIRPTISLQKTHLYRKVAENLHFETHGFNIVATAEFMGHSPEIALKHYLRAKEETTQSLEAMRLGGKHGTTKRIDGTLRRNNESPDSEAAGDILAYEQNRRLQRYRKKRTKT